jgi:hypothetical protein
MIEKIISGGQTGADQAAQDAADKLGIPHSSWIAEGYITGNRKKQNECDLIEIPSTSYSERAKKNIRESDGTLIFSHGMLTGGSEYTRRWARTYGKPLLHIDLSRTAPFNAAVTICNWMSDFAISVLNVAGPRSSKDSKIYKDTFDILESVYCLNLVEQELETALQADDRWMAEEHPSEMPKSVEEAVEDVIGEMDFKNKAAMANLEEKDLHLLQPSLGMYVKQKLKIWFVNKDFEISCIRAGREDGLDESNLQMAIIRRIWKKLRKMHKLRVVN